MARDSYVGLANVFVALLQRHRLKTVWWGVEYQLTLVEDALAEAILLGICVNAVRKERYFQKWLTRVINLRFLLISCNIDPFLYILWGWFEEFWSINIISEKYGAPNTAASRRIYAT